MLAVVTSDGLALPTAWRLPIASAAVHWGGAAGDRGVTHGHEIRLPRRTIRAVRTWRPARVRVREHPIDLHGPPLGWARERIGRGPGLTPEGDDEVCGALLVAYAAGDPRLALATQPLLSRTSALSASLLRAAADGYAVPDLVTYVQARFDADVDLASQARAAVLTIGHTSGDALVRGVDTTLDLLTPPLTSPLGPIVKETAHA